MQALKFLDIKEQKEKSFARFEMTQQLNSLAVKSVLSIDLELAGIDHTHTLDEIVHRAKEEALKLYKKLNSSV